jgi:hypothetical protein
MRAKHMAHCLLLAATVGVSGCLESYDLVGRWDLGSSSFHFRKDGLLFYLSPSKIRYQGQYSYDDSTEPGIVRAQLQPMSSDRSPIALELLVTFLGPDRIRFEIANGSRKRTLIGARLVAPIRQQATEDVASAPSKPAAEE